MAYPKDAKEIKQRNHSFEDLGIAGVNDKTLSFLDRDLGYFLREAGIPLGQDRKVPETGGIPRIFVMGVDAQGVERPMSLEEAGLDLSPGNRKFWEQVNMGNVFAYPAGEDNPVQLQANLGDYQGKFGYSKPVLPENMPARQMKRPGFFARFMHGISGGRLYKEVAVYNDLQTNERRLETQSKLESFRSAREFGKVDERVEAQVFEDNIRKQKEQQSLEGKLSDAKKEITASADGYKIFHSVYKPVPEKHEYLRKDPDKGKFGLYTDQHFADIKVFSKDELDLSKITLAPKGKLGPAVSEKDYCAVAMFAAMKPEAASKTKLYDESFAKSDIHCAASLQKLLGISKEQAEQLSVSGYNGAVTTDLFIVPASRDNNGTYFKDVLNTGRQTAADAFNAYKNGNKEPLAKLIAFGIDQTCNQMVSIVSAPGNETKGGLAMGLHLTTMMKKDPELKQLAFKNGMTQKQLKSVEMMPEYFKLDTARKDAELKLAESAAKGTVLSGEEKEACMKAILKARLFDQIWVSEARKETDKTREVEEKLLGNMEPIPEDKHDLWMKHPEMRPEPPEGKIWQDSAVSMTTYAQRLFREIPPVIGTLKNQASLDEIVDRMVLEDAPAGKSAEELYKIAVDSKTANNLPARSMRIAEDIKNEKLLGLDKNQNANEIINEAVKEEPKKQEANQPAADDDPELGEPLKINDVAGKVPQL